MAQQRGVPCMDKIGNWRLECKGDNAKAKYATIAMSRVGAMRLKSLACLAKNPRFKVLSSGRSLDPCN